MRGKIESSSENTIPPSEFYHLFFDERISKAAHFQEKWVPLDGFSKIRDLK